MRPTVKLQVSGPGGEKVKKSLAELTRSQVLVGIPTTTARARALQIQQMAKKAKARKIKETINNAELLYIHTNGSPLRHIPARPVIEAAIMEPDNRKVITDELGEVGKAALAGDVSRMEMFLKRAGLTAQNLVRAWFTNPKNHWAPNAPSTIRRKGSSRPLIDTSALRSAITYVIEKL